jgi:Tfp pilus assembly protein PilX
MTRSALGRSRLASQAGFAIPAAIAVLLILTLLVGAASIAAVSSSGAARTDLNGVRAQQAADAGLRVAAYEYNSLAIDAGAFSVSQACSGGASSCTTKVRGPCLAGSSAGMTAPVQAGGTSASPQWCSAVTNDMGDGVTYSYVASPPSGTVSVVSGSCLLGLLCISGVKPSNVTMTRTFVSTGSAGNQTRTVLENFTLSGSATPNCLAYLLGLCVNIGTVPYHLAISQLYAPVSGSYRACSSAAASVPAGQDPTSKC